ncbi:MAG: DUF503 domain-containing protein [Candidatus Eisenbacteria sp.]|nr:DUF503 domain-containing protein [Candidatus Eisenbacteria bacterium]
MFFAICRFEVLIPQGRSLKDKRSVVRSLKERLRSRFHVSVSEVANQDLRQRGTIGIALIGARPRSLESALEAMRRLVDQETRCYVASWETRVEPFEGAPCAPKDHILSAGMPVTPTEAWDETHEDDEHFDPAPGAEGKD